MIIAIYWRCNGYVTQAVDCYLENRDSNPTETSRLCIITLGKLFTPNCIKGQLINYLPSCIFLVE